MFPIGYSLVAVPEWHVPWISLVGLPWIWKVQRFPCARRPPSPTLCRSSEDALEGHAVQAGWWLCSSTSSRRHPYIKGPRRDPPQGNRQGNIIPYINRALLNTLLIEDLILYIKYLLLYVKYAISYHTYLITLLTSRHQIVTFPENQPSSPGCYF